MATRTHRFHKDVTGDFVKYIRQNYNPSTAYVNDGKKVIKRTENSYFREGEEGWWLSEYWRRGRNLQVGFFSSQCQPYKPLGTVELDPQKLVLSVLADSLHKHKQPVSVIRENKIVSATNTDLDRNRGEQNEQMKCEAWGGGVGGARGQQSAGAGIRQIHGFIREAEDRITAVKGGQSYVKHVLTCQADKYLEKEKAAALEESTEDTMKLKRLSSHYLYETIATVGVPIGDAAQSAKHKQLFGRKFTIKCDENMITVGLKTPEGGEKSSFSQRKPRRLQQMFMKKLEAIHTLLVSVPRLKSKLLKQKHPLPQKLVKSLREKRLKNLEDMDISTDYMLRSSGRAPLQPSMDTMSLTAPSATSTSATGSILNFSRHHTQDNRLDSSTINASKKRGRLSMRGDKDLSLHPFRMETWDDLMTVNSKTKHKVRKLLPWQSGSSGCRAESAKVESGASSETDRPPEGMVKRIRDELHRMKEDNAILVETRLAKVDRERLFKSQYKLQQLKELRPLYQMYSKNVQTGWKAANKAHQRSTRHDQLPEWYESLVMEHTSFGFGHTDESKRIFEDLKKLAIEDIPFVNSLKDKLCLLVISLPAHEICTVHMQNAIKFVLTMVIGEGEEHLHQWLAHRNLYVI